MAIRAAIFAFFLALAASPALGDWASWRPEPSDATLERIVRAAYVGAAASARANNNYFARDGVTEGLEAAIGEELARAGFATIEVSTAGDLGAARKCAAAGIALRFAVTVFGDGISIAAASPNRVFSYHYDPHEDAAIVVEQTGTC
jgi:hypothetical protein